MFRHLVMTVAASFMAVQSNAMNVQAAVALANEIGVSAESLVLCEIATSQCSSASAILNRIDQAGGLAAAVTATRITVDEAGQLVTALATQIQTAGDDELLVAAYHQAVTDLEIARASYFAARQALRDEALDGVDIAKVQRLITWQSVATRNVPAAFRVLELTDAQWDAVERALRAERRAARLGETLDHDYAQLLANVRSNVDVIDAQYQLAANLSAIELVFSQFTGE